MSLTLTRTLYWLWGCLYLFSAGQIHATDLPQAGGAKALQVFQCSGLGKLLSDLCLELEQPIDPSYALMAQEELAQHLIGVEKDDISFFFSNKATSNRTLPDVLVEKILSFCLLKDVLACAQASVDLYKFIMNEPLKQVWKAIGVVEVSVNKLIFVDRLPVGVLAIRLKPQAAQSNDYKPLPVIPRWLTQQKYLTDLSCKGVDCIVALPERLFELTHLRKLNLLCTRAAIKGPPEKLTPFINPVLYVKGLKHLILPYELLQISRPKETRNPPYSPSCVETLAVQCTPGIFLDRTYAQWRLGLALFPRVQHLTLEGFSLFSGYHEVNHTMFEHLSQLTTLKVDYRWGKAPLGEAEGLCLAIAKKTDLRVLDVHNVTPEVSLSWKKSIAADFLAPVTKLEKLKLSTNTSKQLPSNLFGLSSSRLRTLTVSGFSLSIDFAPNFSLYPNLQRLEFTECTGAGLAKLHEALAMVNLKAVKK